MTTLTGLPLSIKDLLHGHSVEWERLEFKEGWNPLAVLHTICAFANDFNNLGGGYVILGVAQDKDGRPELPPIGISLDKVDTIQRELLELGASAIQPPYHPLITPAEIQGKTILVIWVPGGQTRPYRAKRSLGNDSKEWLYYIRKLASTVTARGADERELLSLTADIPFDDRINQRASVADLSLSLMLNFLQEVNSELANPASNGKMERAKVEALGRQMNIVGGPPELAFPKNVGLMFFSDSPTTFFPATQIDVVWFPEGEGGDRIEEKTFTGPLARMTREALSYIERNYLKYIIFKRSDRAEADRVWNFPYAAVEEAVVNAVYHRSYEIREPIEVRVTTSELTILSFPGPDRSIKLADLQEGKAIARRYRNRRIGEFLKELELTEGRCTGIPKMLRAMRENGSPPPVFESDAERSYFVVRLSASRESLGGVATASSMPLSELESNILRVCSLSPKKASELLTALSYKSRTGNFKKAIARLLEEERAIEYTLPNTPRSRNQRYRITERGRHLLRSQPGHDKP